MKDIDDLFLKAHYSDLTPSEQTLIEDLCSDEVSFQQVKALVNRSMDTLPVSPPAHLLEALNQTFDQTYSQPSAKGMRPRMFNLFIASAVAATVLIFLTVYYFGINNEPKEQLARVEKKEQKKKNNQTKASSIVEKTQTPKVASLEPIPAPPVALDVEAQTDVLMDEPVASIEMEDAKQEELRGSRSDVESVSRDMNATYNEPKSNTYMWTSADKHLASDQVVIAQESRKKQTKSDSKRLNTSLMLKQIKPVY
jgi:hypothetical protein